MSSSITERPLFQEEDGGVSPTLPLLSVEEIRQLVQKALSPELLKGRWRTEQGTLDGHCYVASEALWHLLDKSLWQPHYALYMDAGGRATHWWLVHKDTLEIADPTKEQYDGYKFLDKNLEDGVPPYKIGKIGNFLTKEPSKRAKIVIDRVYFSYQLVWKLSLGEDNE